jgi:hypothetical protein
LASGESSPWNSRFSDPDDITLSIHIIYTFAVRYILKAVLGEGKRTDNSPVKNKSRNL